MPLDLARIHAICFDIDGTLRDTDDQLVQQLERALRPLRFLLPEHDIPVFARRVIMFMEEPGNFVKGLADTWHLDGHLAQLSERFRKPGNQPRRQAAR